MADKTFTAGTIIDSAWLNDVNRLTYDIPSTASGKGAALVGYNSTVAYPAGSVGARIGQVVDVTAFPFLADQTGATSATLAIEAAAATLQDGDTLWFPPGGTYLIDYPWAAFSDSDPVGLPGRAKAVIYLTDKKRITIQGNNCKIVTTNHPIDTKGGFMFVLAQRCPDIRVTGFRFEMSFSGMNTLSSRYPMAGGVWVNDAITGTGVQGSMCCNVEIDNCTFKLFHPNGAFSVTSAPYGSDNNNGHKIISVFAAGDGSATSYANQNRGLKVHDIRFLDGHNGYGCWGVAYNDAEFYNITSESSVAAFYTQATTTFTGDNFGGPVRFFQYYCNGFSAHHIKCRSKPWAERTGSFVGLCGAVNFHSGINTTSTGGGSIHDIQVTLDAGSTSLGSTFDLGVYVTATGCTRIHDIKIDMHTQSAAIGILLAGQDNIGTSNVMIEDVFQSERCNGPMVELTNTATVSDARRTIKSVKISDCVARGFGAVGAVFSLVSGAFYGCEFVSVTNCEFTGTNSVGPGFAVDVRGRTSADVMRVVDITAIGAAAPWTGGSSTVFARDNYGSGSTANGGVSLQTTNLQNTTNFTAGQAVTIAGLATGELAEYKLLEITGAGAVVADSAGLASSATGTIRTVGAGNTCRITWKKVSNQR